MTVHRPHSCGQLPFAVAGTALLGLVATIASASVIKVGTASNEVALLSDDVALIMDGTDPCCVTSSTPWLEPPAGYLAEAQKFIVPHFPGYTSVGLAIPDQLAPTTGLDSEPFGISLQQGTDVLNTAISNDIDAGDGVVAFGYSQSATVETMELERLAALPADARPSPDQLAFVMIGDGNNPDGGLLERFDGAFIPSLDASFSGATPADVYPTDIYTLQYDGWADFPQYPANILADLNAFFGIDYVHGTYPLLTPEQIASAPELSTVGDTMTHYYLVPTQNLPLLEPLQQLGAPQWLIDLIQPDLRVLIDLGYGTGPANVATPAELFNTDVNPITVADDLVKGTVQGMNNALTALGLPDLPAQLTGPIGAVETALGTLADQINPAVQATNDGLQHAANSVVVPAQLADALSPVSGAISSLSASLSQLVDDQIDPAIQGAVYGTGDLLRDTLASAGAPSHVELGIYITEQLLPTELETPGTLLTNDVYFVAAGLQDLAANNFAGFLQELQLIPTADISLSLFAGLLPVLGLEDLIAGVPFNL
ncbi:PE-PPE domain-containing protein [Mycobacterium sp.]|uniref:PE-PPE domain-containing protein n=1 Tax=Mycobacterium sp. TaxID=1785 RepID=UPI0031E243F8